MAGVLNFADHKARHHSGGTDALAIASLTGYVAPVPVIFPATQVPSSDPNTLDDYEEGTWTPSVGGSATYNYQLGGYIKVGKLVYIIGDMNILVIGTGSTNTLSGLPFAVDTNGHAAPVAYFNGIALSEIFVVGVLMPSTSTMKFRGQAAADANIDSDIALFGSGATVAFSAVYQTTA